MRWAFIRYNHWIFFIMHFLCNCKRRLDRRGKKLIHSSTYAYVYLLIVATEVIKLENLIKIFTMSILSFFLTYVLILSLSHTHFLSFSLILISVRALVSWANARGQFNQCRTCVQHSLDTYVFFWLCMYEYSMMYMYIQLLIIIINNNNN